MSLIPSSSNLYSKPKSNPVRNKLIIRTKLHSRFAWCFMLVPAALLILMEHRVMESLFYGNIMMDQGMGNPTSLRVPVGLKAGRTGIALRGSRLVRIVSAYIGAKLKACAYPHNAQGERSRMVHHTCPAKRKIFVLCDPTIRIAVVVPDHEHPHSHPVFPPAKTPFDVAAMFRQCVEALGVADVTTGSLEFAPSMQLILNGKTPGEFHALLHSKRKKNEIVHLTKQIQFPSGFGIEGVLKLFQEDTQRSDVKERYVHHLTTTPMGGTLICTFVPFLLSLIHYVNGFQVDVTYKRVYGPLKEWEVTIWLAALTRAVTIGRVYTDKADREHYKIIFDELQRWVRRLTGKPLRFKRLSKGGNLIYLDVDLEAAQVLGAGDSFLPTNEPEYSGIHSTTSEEIVGYFIRACSAHVNCGIRDLRPLMASDEDYQRLLGFSQLKSDDELKEFDAWITSKGITKLLVGTQEDAHMDHGRVAHSQSKIYPDDWDIIEDTTNINEGQHFWTSRHTGTNLSLLEAIVKARKLDQAIAAEIEGCMKSGVLTNSTNDLYNRMLHNCARNDNLLAKSTASRKAKEQLKENMAEGAGTVKKPAPRRPAGRRTGPVAESSSSGRAPAQKANKGKAHAQGAPYPTPNHGSDALALQATQPAVTAAPAAAAGAVPASVVRVNR
ncbi:hypothetical protein HGRIS_013557 [Hohenbuehelia grisea]|uniref:Uncharacterized protein n=1 Tax=Hohenbuehelia grisea TaxID=104357 RepID=A0ABR3IVQ5_9AGAR